MRRPWTEASRGVTRGAAAQAPGHGMGGRRWPGLACARLRRRPAVTLTQAGLHVRPDAGVVTVADARWQFASFVGTSPPGCAATRPLARHGLVGLTSVRDPDSPVAVGPCLMSIYLRLRRKRFDWSA
jgi:hypothetical protein